VQREANRRFYSLLEHLEALTGDAVVLNTSLNRRGEPLACSPDDALDIFLGTGLQYLVMEDLLITKPGSDDG
jgi:carbamoyltransferase